MMKRNKRSLIENSSLLFYLLFVHVYLYCWCFGNVSANTYDCFGVLSNNASVCSSHGFCVAEDTCMCHDNYQLPHCQDRSSGHVFAAGDNTNNQLGDPTLSALSSLTMIRAGDYLGLMRVEAVSAGDGFSLALTTKGEVYAWGKNTNAQLGLGFNSVRVSTPTLVRGDIAKKRIVSIAACFIHALAADSDGNVYSWGSNQATEGGILMGGWLGFGLGSSPNLLPKKVSAEAAFTNIVKVTCGRYHSVALNSLGLLFTWGASVSGQLGQGISQLSTGVPTQIMLNSSGDSLTWIDVAAGNKHNIALDSQRRAFTWGDNSYSQTCHSSTTLAFGTPTLVVAPQFFSFVEASSRSTYGIAINGVAYACGYNGKGESGGSDTAQITVGLVQVAPEPPRFIFSGFSAENVVAVGATTNQWYGWGNNKYGQFGINSTGSNYLVAPEISPPYLSSTIISASVGTTHTLYLIDSITCFSIYPEDSLVCSGHGICIVSDICLCDAGFTGSDCSLPFCFGVNASEAMVCSGHGQCLTSDTCLCHQGYSGERCEIMNNGFLYASGDNSYGQLSDNYGYMSTLRLIPIVSLAFAGVPVHGVASGFDYSLILLSNGILYSVGRNDRGQLGDRTYTNRNYPVITFSGNAVSMCAGVSHSLVIDRDGRVWAFGDNSYGQLATGVSIRSSTPLLVGGTLENERVVSVSCGAFHSVALLRNGTVVAWGRNNQGQLGDGTITNKLSPQTVYLTGLLYRRRASAISAGGAFTMAIGDEGTLYRWGENTYGQLATGTTAQIKTPIALTGPFASKTITGIIAGSQCSYVIADGDLYSSGVNSNGQLGITGTPALTTEYTMIDIPLASNASLRASLCDSTVSYSTAGAIANSVAYVWGYNSAGQLGIGTKSQSNEPKEYNIYFPDRRVVDMSLGCTHSLVLYNMSQSCFGILADEPLVCSHHGDCTGFDQCSCYNGYRGEKCEVFECYGVANDNFSVVCSGRGACIGVDACVCHDGFSGANCENIIRGIGYALGRQNVGQLANDDVPSTGFSSTPLLIGGQLSKRFISKVDGGVDFSIALTLEGDLFAWGSNKKGLLGDGTTINKDRPHIVLNNVIDSCASDGAVVALSTNGTVVVFGVSDNLQGAYVSGYDEQEKPKSVACGKAHLLILTDIGTVYSYDLGNNDQHVQKVLGLENILKIAAGDNHSLALGSYGQVYSWGKNNRGQLADMTTEDKYAPVLVVDSIKKELIVHVAASTETSFAVTNKGEVFSWGSNLNGLLGNSLVSMNRPSPERVKNLEGVHITSVEASSSGAWVTAISRTGAGFAWGRNTYSQLGDSSNRDKVEPVPIAANNHYFSAYLVGVGAANSHSLLLFNGTVCHGILADDPLVCSSRGTCVHENHCICNEGYFGTECNETTCFGVNSTNPNVCSGRGACIAKDICSCSNGVSRGSNCEMDVWGYLFGVGSNINGQLGDNTQGSLRSILGPVLLDKRVSFVSSGNDFSLAITVDGQLYTWGLNDYFNLGLGDSKTARKIPEKLMPTLSFVSASAAQYHASAVTTAGEVYTWGANTLNGVLGCTYRQCGFCDFLYVPCLEDSCCSDIKYGNTKPTIIGLLGLGSSGYYRKTPQLVSGINGKAISVACGVHHCLVLTSIGEVWAWGDNTFGQLGNGSYGEKMYAYTPVRVANSLEKGGTLDSVRIVSIAAGSYHSMAISSNGELFVWGSNNLGQIGDGIVRELSRYPKQIVGIVAKTITAGEASSFVVSGDGKVFSWGSNSNYQLGVNSTISLSYIPMRVPLSSMITSIDASKFGGNYVLVGDSQGDGYSWGYGDYFQSLSGLINKRITPGPTGKYYTISNTQTLYTNRSIVAVSSGPRHSLLLLYSVFCQGLYSDDPYACSSRGTCVSNNTCMCDSGYYGDDCSETQCLGVFSTHPSVCSGVGRCVAYDVCSCSIGYTGDNCSVMVYGDLYSIGSNAGGQLGDDSLNDHSNITQAYSLTPREQFKFIDAGVDFTVALTGKSKLFVWGQNSFYNLGAGTLESSLRPMNILSSDSIVSVCAGISHGVAVNSDGQVFSWGSNTETGTFNCLNDATKSCAETSCTCTSPSWVPVIAGTLGLSGYY